MSTEEAPEKRDFVRQKVRDDLAAGKHEGRVQTRFPPEPNGYLHIGHAKAICVSFGIAQEFEGGQCNLRFDDTNPVKEDDEYVEAIRKDIRWLGFDWGEREFFASDYFDQLYAWAEELIEKDLAYVEELGPDEIKAYRGTPSEPGKNSPWRDRPKAESLDLFRRMKAGEFEDGKYVLRAKIDMASPNFNLRDPALYRIRHAHHHRTGDRWCIYPMYDFAHGQSDAIEGITHSLCSLEFENHRPLYDWFLDNLSVPHRPEQTEFARLNITHTLMSKRKLLMLVEEKIVNGWDDPRMPTLSGLRRRGVPPQAIRNFCDTVGVAKFNSTVDWRLFEHHMRDVLNKTAQRLMMVKDPVRLVVTNYPEGQVEEMDAINNPEDEGAGTRKVPFARELLIERDDFLEEAPKKYFRMVPGREVRLRYGYVVMCTGCEKDADGNITAVHCTYDPETRGGDTPDGRKIKGTIHWVASETAVRSEVRDYDHLFSVENPGQADDIHEELNPNSLKVLPDVAVEPAVKTLEVGAQVQFERIGYYTLDADSTDSKPVLNRTVSLKDGWAKQKKQQNQHPNQGKGKGGK